MRVEDFDYELPEALIAQAPTAERSASRLLYLPSVAAAPRDLGDGGPEPGEPAPRDPDLRDLAFTDLPSLLRAGDLLVINDTRVVKARLAARKDSGGEAEVLVERPLADQRFLAHVRASRAPREGTVLVFAGGERALVRRRVADLFELELVDGPDRDPGVREDSALAALMAAHGAVPLPPYIRRDAGAADEARYQTVYAARDGAIAAPTAGLHFDEALLAAVRARGVGVVPLTLHVGAGTFQPVRAESLDEHVMHAERAEVGAELCAAVAAARAAGGRVVAVGTTCVRALESAAARGTLKRFHGETRLFIHPGHRFRVVDALLTNFHLPRSTLLMLVSAFAGHERVMAAYRHAVAAEYRFFSYGDAMFVERHPA